eukprot:TRINITY_DN55669_c0_g1_i1.p1 TRINITY_DN55669_c0_g1~~TRINITY_DN55669_c0_g1_i1.p1  ORF type:complete len:270 (-),score=6.30 TRINITY_DN55669_c0_g1_i1:64-873(-)
MVFYKVSEHELSVHGTQDQVYQARQHLQPIEPCLFGMKCSKESCPYLHVVSFKLCNALMDSLPSEVQPSLRSWLKQKVNVESGEAPASNATHNRKMLVPCRFNKDCTNRACDFMHAKSIDLYDGVRVGNMIGKKGQNITTIMSETGSFVKLSKHSTFWMIGTQTAVFLAEKALRQMMLRFTPCRFGMKCTAQECKFQHPKNHSASNARRTTACRYGMNCTDFECKFKHSYLHSASRARRRLRARCTFGWDCTRSSCTFAHPFSDSDSDF